MDGFSPQSLLSPGLRASCSLDSCLAPSSVATLGTQPSGACSLLSFREDSLVKGWVRGLFSLLNCGNLLVGAHVCVGI